MVEQEYLTVGQLAKKVGTTVRTIQYYDQLGLLTPSAKGPGNQRLYTSEDENNLYRILTLKYLGLSLADIRGRMGQVTDAAAFRDMLSQTMEALEADFQQLVTRLSVLRSLLNRSMQSDDIDWAAFARTIEDEQGDADFFWHHMVDIGPETEAHDRVSHHPQRHSIAVAKWHELVADAIALMSAHVKPDDPRAAEIALRYRQLLAEQTGSIDEMFILAENITPHHGASGSFDVLRESVMKYLEDVSQANAETSA